MKTENKSAIEFASRLNGRKMGEEITHEEEREAKALGLFVVFGYSDDLAEFRGAIHDEVVAISDVPILIHKNGIMERHEDCGCEHCGYMEKANGCYTIWTKYSFGDYSWQYETSIPHATFEIFENGEKFCLGLVIHVDALPSIK